jgi:hypothetical protein
MVHGALRAVLVLLDSVMVCKSERVRGITLLLPLYRTDEIGTSDITEVVVVLNSQAAVEAFSQGGNVTIGGSQKGST